jgi:hypothetical protein
MQNLCKTFLRKKITKKKSDKPGMWTGLFPSQGVNIDPCQSLKNPEYTTIDRELEWESLHS